MSDLRIEYASLEEIVRWPRNPKDHDTLAIQKSMKRFGFVMPVLLDEKSGKLMAGHGRIDSLMKIRESNLEPPLRVEVVDGQWRIPVIRGISFANDAEAEAYLLADNRLSEIGGWRKDLLADILQEMVDGEDDLLEGTGFEIDEVAAMLAVGKDKPSLEDLENQYGSHDDSEFWPVVKVKISPAVKAKFDTLMEALPGDNVSEKFLQMIELAEQQIFIE